MSENLDLKAAGSIDSVSELPTSDGPTLRGRRVIAGRYEILSKLGGGGMGEVWHAYDVKLRVDVALKSLRFDWKGSQDPTEALRREVRTAREVVSPNVCRIFDLVVEEDSELISMEYIDGVTLLSMLAKKGAIELQQARDIAAQFLAGLQAVHHAGLVHRDLKPENIMITRTGRVVVMDFGIAKQETQISGTISGTVPYMSPEQLAGEKVDARSDIFSAGVVLAEMIHPEGLLKQKTREEIWNAVRQDPMRLPDGPWKPVIARAVAASPADRFPSAAALARALEEATQRVDTIDERKPYPGLASFSASDAEYFFGRELEVETLIKKLQQLHFTALIGPSGTGKTSLLSAGLIPALPDVWSHIVCYPGDSPLLNLAQALAPQLSGDAEAFAKMVRFEEPEAAVWILKRWRQKHSEALLIVDRFEELFTLNNTETQTRFSELLGRAVLEADVRVLLTMRDDFLMFCHQQPALLPIFSELTGLSPLGGAGLRRALVQPALKCGYRFEDEILVDEILSDVERERGALPLMAFAAAQLWEKRDQQCGELQRAAYMEIGGVAGALAKHAEQTMARIGVEREPIVREIFRNLITAQNTRAARDTEELLSVFPEREAAEEVLRTLIDARLLTSFEAPQVEGEKPRRRVEIIHESLLMNWPRLVRWQTQDADSAQLRDQLRQAAQLWEQRKRSEDLLWTGTAFLEFQAWRQRYGGGLTATEEAFAQAMQERSNRRRRQRRIVVAAAFVVLLGILAVIGAFWRGAEVAREKAVLEARRAEAGKLVALGQGELEKDTTQALAYAIASMEEADTPAGRFFAMKALWKGPSYTAYESTIRPLTHAEFSPDGKWLVLGGIGGVHVIGNDGSPPLVLSDYYPKDTPFRWPFFSDDGEYVIWRSSRDVKVVKVWSLSQKKVVREFHMEGFTSLKVKGSKVFFVTDMTGQFMTTGKWGRMRVRSWDWSDSEPEVLGHWDRSESNYWDIDPAGRFLGYARGMDIYTRPLDQLDTAPETHIGKHKSDVTAVTFHPDGEQIASADSSGEIRIRPFLPDSKKEPRVFFEKGGVSWSGLYFDNSGSFLAIKVGESEVRIRDLLAPPETRSLSIYNGAFDLVHYVAFHPKEPRIILVTRERVLVYALGHTYPQELQSDQTGSWDVAFTPGGQALVTSFLGSPIQFWQIADHGVSSRRDIRNTLASINRTAVDPRGKFILTTFFDAQLISLPDETVQSLPELLGGLKEGGVAISADGKFAAAAKASGLPEDVGIEIWNIKTKTVHVLEQTKGKAFLSVKFLPDGSLVAGDMQGSLWHWNFSKDTGTILFKKSGMVFDLDVSVNGRLIVATVLSAKQLGEVQRSTSELIVYDIAENTVRNIISHGNRICSVAFGPDGQTLVTGDLDGIVRVGSISGEPPHVLLESETPVFDVSVHPAGKWIASSERAKPVVRLWPMPQGKPFHTLPYEEFLNRLRALTNVRAVKDESGSTGYKIEYAPFPGWKELPRW